MAEITLADYTGYLFLEIIKAREMADAYSRTVAERYAADPVLQHFATPRFRVPKLSLKIPVLIAGARFSQVVKFTLTKQEFSSLALARLEDLLRTVRSGNGGVVPTLRASRPSARPRAARAAASSTVPLIDALHAGLLANAEPADPRGIVQEHWARIVAAALDENGLAASYAAQYPDDALLRASGARLTEAVVAATVVSKTEMSSLLVNPETHAVAAGSGESSVFVISADLAEEGFSVKTISDPGTGAETKIVDFD